MRTDPIAFKQLFTVDTPGFPSLPLVADYRATYKAKFREWGEVKIGDKWYVCSPYKNWKSILYVKYKDASTGWELDATKTSEIVEGTLSGFAGSWSE